MDSIIFDRYTPLHIFHSRIVAAQYYRDARFFEHYVWNIIRPNYIFINNNKTNYVIRVFFSDEVNICWIVWPLNSLDLNLIELVSETLIREIERHQAALHLPPIS